VPPQQICSHPNTTTPSNVRQLRAYCTLCSIQRPYFNFVNFLRRPCLWQGLYLFLPNREKKYKNNREGRKLISLYQMTEGWGGTYFNNKNNNINNNNNKDCLLYFWTILDLRIERDYKAKNLVCGH
jgi:hypothetical protein